MGKVTVSLVIVVILLAIPQVLALQSQVQPEGGITLLAGDYSSGTLTLVNKGALTYRIAGYQKFWVEDDHGNPVGGFNLTVFPKTFSDWGPGTGVVINYNLTGPKGIKGGDYTLYLRFLAVVSGDSSYHIIQVAVPLHVIEKPLQFGVAGAYVVENPDSPYALNGQTIAVFSNVKNLGHRPVEVNASVELSRAGKVYFRDKKKVRIEPGERLIRFEIPLSYNLPSGTYRISYRVDYPEGTFFYHRDFPIKFGVSLEAASVENEEVVPGEENEAYLTVVSLRSIDLNVSVVAEVNNSTIEGRESVSVNPGTSILRVKLPTERPGNVTAELTLSYGKRTLGKAEVSYRVLSPPELENVSYTLHDNIAEFSIVLYNPEERGVDGRLVYNLSRNGEVLYGDSLTLQIPPGRKTLSMRFQLPRGENISYSFTLYAWGRAWNRKEGTVSVPLPSPPTTTTAPTSTTSTTVEPPTSSTTSTAGNSTSEGGGPGLWLGMGIVILLLALVLAAWYYPKANPKRKKRVRPKPKRRSPLGRFKRPKKPEFKENKELPKRR